MDPLVLLVSGSANLNITETIAIAYSHIQTQKQTHIHIHAFVYDVEKQKMMPWYKCSWFIRVYTTWWGPPLQPLLPYPIAMERVYAVNRMHPILAIHLLAEPLLNATHTTVNARKRCRLRISWPRLFLLICLVSVCTVADVSDPYALVYRWWCNTHIHGCIHSWDCSPMQSYVNSSKLYYNVQKWIHWKLY